MTNETNSLPSLASAAMLSELSISMWTARKLDKKTSNEVTSGKHAKAGMATVYKKLLGDCKELDAIQKHVGAIRTAFYAATLPWSDAGSIRILPVAAYFDFHYKLTSMEQEFYTLVNTFVDAYDQNRIQAQQTLGDLFDAQEYPPAESVRHKFRFTLGYMPLPEAGDFRVDIGNEAMQELSRRYEKSTAEKLETAMHEVWDRVAEALTRMSERLDYATEQDKKIFRDTLVTNVKDIAALLDTCNITQNAHMTKAAADIKRALEGVTPEGLRHNEGLRIKTKKAVDEVIANLPTLKFR